MNATDASILDNKSDFTGNAFEAWSTVLTLWISGDLGPSGIVYIERKGQDGAWKRYASLTFETLDAHVFRVNIGATLRLVVESAVSVDIEVQ